MEKVLETEKVKGKLFQTLGKKIVTKLDLFITGGDEKRLQIDCHEHRKGGTSGKISRTVGGTIRTIQKKTLNFTRKSIVSGRKSKISNLFVNSTKGFNDFTQIHSMNSIFSKSDLGKLLMYGLNNQKVYWRKPKVNKGTLRRFAPPPPPPNKKLIS